MMENENKRNMGKRVLSAIGAGVIGSLFTLTVALNTDFLNKTPQEVVAPEVKDSAYTVDQISTKNELSLADMVEKSSGAIVGIANFQDKGNRFSQEQQSVESGAGSGVIYKIAKDYAYIVTNNHVIENAGNLEVSFENGETTTAQVVGQDALSDLAVLKVDAKYADTTLAFGDSDTLRAGDQVVAIGNPLGLDFSGTVTQGIVSAVNRSINIQTSAGDWELNVIQTDAAINPGNSGGALLNDAGQVIGINSLKIFEKGIEGLGFAIPSNEVVPLIEEMTKSGTIERPYMGVGMLELNQVSPAHLQDLPQSVKGGVMITNVDPDSAAGQAGIEVQDIVTAINDTEIKNSTDLRKFLYTELKIGDQAVFTVYRGKEMKSIELTVTSNREATK